MDKHTRRLLTLSGRTSFNSVRNRVRYSLSQYQAIDRLRQGSSNLSTELAFIGTTKLQQQKPARLGQMTLHKSLAPTLGHRTLPWSKSKLLQHRLHLTIPCSLGSQSTKQVNHSLQICPGLSNIWKRTAKAGPASLQSSKISILRPKG